MVDESLLITNGYVVTMDRAGREFDNGYVLVRDRHIAAVGPMSEAPPTASAVVDARGCIVIPGLINTHQHPWLTLFKSLPQALHQTPGETVGKLSPLATLEDWVAGAALGYVEMLLSGTTTVLNHWNTPTRADDVARIVSPARELGLRMLFAKELRLVPSLDENVAIAREVSARFNGDANGLLRVGFVVDPGMIQRDRGAADDDLVLAGHGLAREFGTRLSSHVASYGGYRDLLRKYHETDIEYLARLGVLDEHWVLGHAIHVSDGDIELIARGGASVSHTPTSESTRGGGIAPVTRMRQAGVRVALGTDSPMVDTSVDMLEQVKAVMLFQNQIHLDPAAITPRDALRMATQDAADSLGMGDVVGSLEPGKLGDLAIYPLTGAATTVWHDAVSVLVRSLHGRDVRTLVIDGRVVIDDGTLVTVGADRVADICDTARDRSRALTARI